MKPEAGENLAERWLDAQLKRYGEIEPRVGLESRILANLQDHAQPEPRIWRWHSWPRLAAIAAIVMASGMVLWLTRVASPPAGIVPITSAAHQTSAPGRAGRAQLAARGLTGPPRRGVKRRTGMARSVVMASSDAATPRLEQFPSPQPLSEQERILADYVAQFRGEAVLVAEAQSRLERQDALGTQRLSSEEDVTGSSEERR
jgi:hypothetical protein